MSTGCDAGDEVGDIVGDHTQQCLPGFAFGTVVLPVEKCEDYVDPDTVLVNHVDSYVGRHIGEFLSQRIVGTAGSMAPQDAEEEAEDAEYEGEGSLRPFQRYWKVLGTCQDARSEIPPWLWAVMNTEDYDAYLKEILKCSVIIYDITDSPTPQRLEEIRTICQMLNEKAETFKSKRTFILISTLHTWSHTPQPDPNDPEVLLSEEDYRRRRTKPLYRDLQLLERHVVASGKNTKGMVKSYVVGAGAVYGLGEGPFHHWFKSAWHNAKHLPIYGEGKNFLPTIYIKDLANIIHNVMDFAPKNQRYILAVDPVVCQQDQIVKAISQELGTGLVKNYPEEQIYLNKEVSTFEADQILLDLLIETTFCKDAFQLDFTAEEGFLDMVRKITQEYKKVRNLEPLKIFLLGPPGVGKSSIARQLSDLYHINHFTKEDLLLTTIDLLRDMAADKSGVDIEGSDFEKEEREKEVAQNLLAEVDAILSRYQDEDEGEGATEKPLRKELAELPDALIVKLFRFRLLSNQCQNQGYILDGFPETYDQGRMLLLAGEESDEYAGEEPGEDGKDLLDRRLVPDKVIVLDASDDFLIQRMLGVPAAQLAQRHQDSEFPALLQDYRDRNASYENTFYYYMDLQEMLYYPIDIAQDTSPMLISTIGRLTSMLGKPRNYGLSVEEVEAIKNAQRVEISQVDKVQKEDQAFLESKDLEERRNNIQQWMEKLAKIKRDEFERDEAAMVPLRHYLMEHVVPTLTRGLIEVTKVRPFDPVEFLAEFMFQHNPAGVNPDSSQKLHEDLTTPENIRIPEFECGPGE